MIKMKKYLIEKPGDCPVREFIAEGSYYTESGEFVRIHKGKCEITGKYCNDVEQFTDECPLVDD